jgi:hypothetical protein
MLKKVIDKIICVNSMTESGIPYRSQGPAEPQDEIDIQPASPDIAEPQTEVPQPNLPITDDPDPGNLLQLYCQICGKTFNSLEELQLHMKTEHAKTET